MTKRQQIQKGGYETPDDHTPTRGRCTIAWVLGSSPSMTMGGCCGDGGHYDGPGTGPSQPLTLSLSKGEGFNTALVAHPSTVSV